MCLPNVLLLSTYVCQVQARLSTPSLIHGMGGSELDAITPVASHVIDWHGAATPVSIDEALQQCANMLSASDITHLDYLQFNQTQPSFNSAMESRSSLRRVWSPSPGIRNTRRRLEPTMEVSMFEAQGLHLYEDSVPPTQHEESSVIDISSDEGMEMVVPRGILMSRWAKRSIYYGISPFAFQNLVAAKAPPILFNALYFLRNHPDFTDRRDISVGDFFAGRGWIYRMSRAKGHSSAKYEINDRPVYNDIVGGWIGFLTALQAVRRLSPGSFSNWATVCRSWIWICRSVTLRSADRPLGPPEEQAHPTPLLDQLAAVVPKRVNSYFNQCFQGCSSGLGITLWGPGLHWGIMLMLYYRI